jgi:hypothetical protein
MKTFLKISICKGKCLYSEYSIIASPPDHKFCCNYRIVAIIDNCNFLKNSYKLQLKKTNLRFIIGIIIGLQLKSFTQIYKICNKHLF